MRPWFDDTRCSFSRTLSRVQLAVKCDNGAIATGFSNVVFRRVTCVTYKPYLRGILYRVIPGITLQRTSVCSVRHRYSYTKLLEVLDDIGTLTKSFCELCTPTYIRPFHTTRNFWMFCKTSVPVPEISDCLVRYPSTFITWNLVCNVCKTMAQYPGYGYNTQGPLSPVRVHSGLTRRV